MTVYQEAAEVMAAAGYENVRMDHDDAVQWELLRRDSWERVRRTGEAKLALTAILAFLAERGLRVVPVEKTFTDAEIASINWPQPGDPHDGIGVDEARDCASGVWAAMIKTIPNVWEEECMTSAALGDAP
jgi:hypothetical protein